MFEYFVNMFIQDFCSRACYSHPIKEVSQPARADEPQILLCANEIVFFCPSAIPTKHFFEINVGKKYLRGWQHPSFPRRQLV